VGAFRGELRWAESKAVERPQGTQPADVSARALADQVGRAVRDPRVLAAVLAVPRHLFVPGDWTHAAYDDQALPLAEGQTVSQPTVVARMAELAAPGENDHVLEVGAGSGYAAAILASLAASVTAMEVRPALADRARANLAAAGVDNVDVVVGNGWLGLPDQAPFDAIVVSAAPPRIPGALVEQLASGGRLVLPLGRRTQRLVRIVRRDDGRLVREDLEEVRFVPLVR
jgi:protein-L-isoaspartate(D-aspartate) O-methyltransferase